MSNAFTPAPVRPPSRLRSILLLLVIFVAGCIVGSVVTIGVGRRIIQRTTNVDNWRPEAMRRFSARLNLTPGQRDRFEPILEEMSARLRLQRIQTARAWSAVFDDTRARLRAELTPEQQREFDVMMERNRTRLRRFLHGGGPGGGGGGGPGMGPGPARGRRPGGPGD